MHVKHVIPETVPFILTMLHVTDHSLIVAINFNLK